MKSVKAILGDQTTVTVERTTSVQDAARVMADHRIGSLGVLEEGRLVGIFTERDVMTRVVAAGLDAANTPVHEVMSSDLIVAGLDESYEDCLTRMQHARVRHLIVLDGGRLAGIVSIRDLMALDLDEKAEAITLLNAYVHYIPADMSPNKTRT
jgi:CBS domain-containing protein